MDGLQEFGIRFIQALQGLSPALDVPMGFFSFPGTILFFLLFLPILYWLVDPGLSLRMLLLLIGADAINNYLKQLLHQPRPYWLGGVVALGDEPTYGAPSGHALISISLWGFLAYKLNRRWIWSIIAVLVLLIGISRMYLGVHFPHDVFVGWLLGLASLSIRRD